MHLLNIKFCHFQAKSIKQVKGSLASTSQLTSSVTSEVTDLQSGTDAKAEAVSVTAGNLSLCKGTDDTADNCIEKLDFRLSPRPLGRSASTGDDPSNIKFHVITSYCIKD